MQCSVLRYSKRLVKPGSEFPYWVEVGRVWEEIGVTPWKRPVLNFTSILNTFHCMEGMQSVRDTRLPGVFAPPVREDLQGLF